MCVPPLFSVQDQPLLIYICCFMLVFKFALFKFMADDY
jgi:hypothetical protein